MNEVRFPSRTRVLSRGGKQSGPLRLRVPRPRVEVALAEVIAVHVVVRVVVKPAFLGLVGFGFDVVEVTGI